MIKYPLNVFLMLFIFSSCTNCKVSEPLSTNGCDSSVVDKLTKAVKKSGGHLNTLRRLKQQSSNWPDLKSSELPPVSSPLMKNVTISWDGSLESVLSVLGDIVVYKLMITGKRPPQPVMVSVNVESQPIYKVLENIGWQAGDNVAVIRDDKKQIIKIIYRNS